MVGGEVVGGVGSVSGVVGLAPASRYGQEAGGLSHGDGFVGVALGVGVAEEEGGVGRSEYGRGVGPVDDPPVTGDETVASVAEEEFGVGVALSVAIAEVNEPCRFTV